ncbi:MAG TPA: hypothetical protein VGP46_07895, partial [Acidimicrobiales bacterium]|nr:hypothetical protein [Acidimicrobiales bacterium]
FPNPEEPGALDLALALAREVGADVVIANDPDGDRLAVAVPDVGASGGWRPLSGDQVGSLLGDYALARTAADPGRGRRLVAASIVSSTMLARIAAAAGAHFEATLTGFKWIVRAGAGIAGARFVFGYEEALGYSIGTVVRDKDGLGAALAFLGLLTEARSRGQSVLDVLDGLESRHGVHLTSQLSIGSASPGDSMALLRSAPPETIGGHAVNRSEDLSTGGTGLPPADVLIYWLDGARIIVRPSGTEPKLKVYFEVVSPVRTTLPLTRAKAGDELAAIRRGVEELLHAR